MLLTKNKKRQIEGVDFNKTYPVIEAVKLLKEKKFVKFDESIEVSINTGIDSKQSDQNVRGSFVPPHGLGKKVVEKFCDLKLIRFPQDIFKLDYAQISKLEGWGKLSVSNFTPRSFERQVGIISSLNGLVMNS